MSEEVKDEFAQAFDEAVSDTVAEVVHEDSVEQEVEDSQPEEISEATNEVYSKAEETEVRQPDEVKAKEKPPEPTVDQLKAQLQELHHKERSTSGRIGAFQKRINDLERQLTERQENILRSLQDGDDKDFRENFPEIANALDKRDQRLAQTVAMEVQKKTMAQLEPLKQAEQQRFVQSQYAALEAAHPNWQQDVRSSDFTQWLVKQPQQVQSLASSDSAEDASALLTFFKATAKPQSAQNVPTAQANEPIDQVNQQRKAKLAQATGIPSRSKPASTSAIPDDFESAFKFAINSDPRFK